MASSHPAVWRQFIFSVGLILALNPKSGSSAQWPPLCPPEILGPHATDPPPLAAPFPSPQPGAVPAAGQLQDPPTPSVTIRVRVPDRVAAGKELEYQLLVENNSQAAAHHVIVRN